MKTKFIIAFFIFIVGLGIGFYFLRPHTFHGTVIQSNDLAYDFTLASAQGNVSPSNFRGKLVMLYFGYTNCVDICPATLANVGQALRQLGNGTDEVQLIMVSLDPERDTPDLLTEYVTQFHPSFVGVTGSKEQLQETATLYGIFYDMTEDVESMDHVLEHTSTLLVLDRDGYLKLTYAFGVTAEEIADDLKYMLRQ